MSQTLLAIRRWNWHQALDAIASVALIIAAGAIVWKLLMPRPEGSVRTPPADGPVPSVPVSVQGAPLRGSPRAKVALIEFAEFECPYCASFATRTLPVLNDRYVNTGRLLVAFMHLPLPMHRSATPAAIAAECAARQGKFWEMHDRLFASPLALSSTDLLRAAEAIPLDLPLFRHCSEDGQAITRIQGDIAAARANDVSGTPTFFVGKLTPDGRVSVLRRLRGSQATTTFVDAIEEVLKKVRG